MIQCLMSEAEVEVRKWGNSLAIIVPADVAKAEDLHPNDRALIRIMKVRYPDPRAFGFLKASRIDPQAMKDEIRREEWAREEREDRERRGRR